MDVVIVELVIIPVSVRPSAMLWRSEANGLTESPPPHQAVEVTDDMSVPVVVANEPVSFFQFTPPLQWAHLWRLPPQQPT